MYPSIEILLGRADFSAVMLQIKQCTGSAQRAFLLTFPLLSRRPSIMTNGWMNGNSRYYTKLPSICCLRGVWRMSLKSRRASSMWAILKEGLECPGHQNAVTALLWNHCSTTVPETPTLTIIGPLCTTPLSLNHLPACHSFLRTALPLLPVTN